MTHQRVLQGYVHLDRVWGTGAALPADTAALACAAALARVPMPEEEDNSTCGNAEGSAESSAAGTSTIFSPAASAGSPAALWDLAQLLALPKWHGAADGAQQAGSMPPAGAERMEVDGESGDGMGSMPAEPSQQLHSGAAGGAAAAAAGADLAARVIGSLEASFFSQLSSPPPVGAGGALACMPEVTWRSLQLATALRHALHPAKSQQAQQEQRRAGAAGAAPRAAATPAPAAGSEQQKQAGGGSAVAAAAAAWDEALERNEMLLLQCHIMRQLSAFKILAERQQQGGTATAAGLDAAGGSGAAAAAGEAGGPVPAAAGGRVSALLMADWIMANLLAQRGQLQPEMLQLAAE